MVENKAIFVTVIGNCAQETLQAQTDASVIGITSQGIFARTPSDHILFLTDKHFRGPLTINLDPQGSFPFHQMEQGIPIVLTPHSLRFPEGLPEIHRTAQTEIFSPPVLDIASLNSADLLKRINRAASCLPPQTDALCGFDIGLVTEFKNLFLNKDQQAISHRLAQLLGCGVGLTPSGDDFICGFFLALAAWGDILFPGFPFQQLFSIIEKLAYQKTTTLSANLIACASRGAADERVIGLLVWLHTGHGKMEKIIEELRGYGSSSGFDTLWGLNVAILSSPMMLSK